MPYHNWWTDNPYIVMVAAIGLILILTNLMVFWKLRITRRLLHKYDQLFKDFNETTLQEILEQVSKMEKENRRDLERLGERVAGIEKRLPGFIGRVAMLRYKGFSDVGGDLSFSIAFLSEKGDGVILTGLHGREESRVWAKPIKGFVSTYQLSPEEEEALRTARDG